MTSAASSGNGRSRKRRRKQRLRWGHTTINQQMVAIATETAFLAAAAAMAAAVAAAVVMATMVAMAAAQMVAAATVAREIFIQRGENGGHSGDNTIQLRKLGKVNTT